MNPQRRLTVRVARIWRQTPHILAFELTHPWGRPLPGYEAGAHIDVHMPGGFSRQYSLARAPPAAAPVMSYLIGVKREAASRGGSASMHERVRAGDLLAVSAPRNTFPPSRPPPAGGQGAAGGGARPKLRVGRVRAQRGASGLCRRAARAGAGATAAPAPGPGRGRRTHRPARAAGRARAGRAVVP